MTLAFRESVAAIAKRTDVTPMLVVPLPLTFALANNWFLYTPYQNLFSAGALVLLGALAGLSVGRIERVLLSGRDRRSQRTIRRALSVVVAATSVFVLLALFHTQIKLLISWKPMQAVLYAASIIAVAALARKSKIEYFNIFLAVFWATSLVSLGHSIFKELLYAEPIEKARERYVFEHTPDIFVLFLESYHSFDVQESVYGIETSMLESYLAEHGFRVTRGIANYAPTVPAAQALFQMEHHYYKQQRGNTDAAQSVRRMLGGVDDNPVLSVLKENGYHTVMLDLGEYLFRERGPLVDASNVERPKKFFSRSNFYYSLRPFRDLHWRLDNALFEMCVSGESEWGDDTARALATFLADAPGDKPVFCFVREGAQHAENWAGAAEFTLQYPRWIESGDEKVIALLEVIRAKRPNALVVLTGDHGALRSLDAWVGPGDPVGNLQERHFTQAEVARDQLDVLFATRWPVEDRWGVVPFDHVNLMRRVFVALSQSEYPTEHKRPSHGYLKVGNHLYRIAEETNFLEHWQRQDPGTALAGHRLDRAQSDR